MAGVLFSVGLLVVLGVLLFVAGTLLREHANHYAHYLHLAGGAAVVLGVLLLVFFLLFFR